MEFGTLINDIKRKIHGKQTLKEETEKSIQQLHQEWNSFLKANEYNENGRLPLVRLFRQVKKTITLVVSPGSVNGDTLALNFFKREQFITNQINNLEVVEEILPAISWVKLHLQLNKELIDKRETPNKLSVPAQVLLVHGLLKPQEQLIAVVREARLQSTKQNLEILQKHPDFIIGRKD